MDYKNDGKSWGYWKQVTNEASLRSADEGREVDALLSAECWADGARDEFGDVIRRDVEGFLRWVHKLSERDQEILCSYWLLGKDQTQIGQLEGVSQTRMSTDLRRAALRYGALLMFGCAAEDVESYAKKIEPVLATIGRADDALAVAELIGGSSSDEIAERRNMRPPELRRRLRKICATLAGDKFLSSEHGVPDIADRKQLALWTVLEDSIEGHGHGWWLRGADVLVAQDPECLGQFEIRLGCEGYDKLFTPRRMEAWAMG